MSKKMGKVAGLLAGFAALFMMGCSSGGGSSIPFIPITGGNNFKTLPVGEFEEEKVNAVLIGETLMRSADKKQKLDELKGI